MKKLTRTISGVTPVAVMTEPTGCPGECVYCPVFPAAPRSYTPESPAVLRGHRCDYDAAAQVGLRLRALEEMGHPTDKIELIVMGGTFLASSPEYQRRFVKGCYEAMNGARSATLDEAKRRNEAAAHRCTGLCIETRPDWCGPAEVERMLELGATRVELGVQMLDDGIYRLVRRGHTVGDVVRATALLRRHGFKVHYHWMPGLPGSTPEKDLALSRMLFEDPRFRPDGLKLYPTMVVAGTELERWYRQGRYTPYPEDTMIALLASIKALVPGYVRISRVLRDIPAQFIVAGCRDSLRGIVQQRLAERGTPCRCIRCREYGHRLMTGRENFAGEETGRLRLARLDYAACGHAAACDGREVFLSYEDASSADEASTLFGLLRLRLQREEPAAVVRELHVYGPQVPLKGRDRKAAQHRGLGRALLREAERIAREESGACEMAVLSGVGARHYYRQLGYRLRDGYMVRPLAAPAREADPIGAAPTAPSARGA